MVCGLPTLLLLTVSVADSFVPDPCRGVKVKTTVQSKPLPTIRPSEHVPKPVLEKSAAWDPVMV